MLKHMGVTAKFLVTITLAILTIQVGTGFLSLTQSKNFQAEQADSFVAKMKQIQAEEEELLMAELYNKEAATAAVLSNIAATSIIGYDFDSLAQLGQVAMQDDDFVFVNFYGTDGSPLTEEIPGQDSVEVISHDLAFDGSPVGVMKIGLSHDHVKHVSAELNTTIEGMLLEAKEAQTKANAENADMASSETSKAQEAANRGQEMQAKALLW